MKKIIFTLILTFLFPHFHAHAQTDNEAILKKIQSHAREYLKSNPGLKSKDYASYLFLNNLTLASKKNESRFYSYINNVLGADETIALFLSLLTKSLPSNQEISCCPS